LSRNQVFYDSCGGNNVVDTSHLLQVTKEKLVLLGSFILFLKNSILFFLV